MQLLRKNNLLKHVYFVEASCCAPELINLFSSRYDPERLGFIRTFNIKQADILILTGYMNEKTYNKLENDFKNLDNKPKVIAVGGCAVGKGPLGSGVNKLPISVFIPGCPPRPESIIDGMVRELKQ
ncbi:MAG: hypothetical protein V1647_03815 [Pseudomonadota bacterium]